MPKTLCPGPAVCAGEDWRPVPEAVTPTAVAVTPFAIATKRLRATAVPVVVMVPLAVAPTPTQTSRTPLVEIADGTRLHVAPQPVTAEMLADTPPVATRRTSTSPGAGVSVTATAGFATAPGAAV
jgi:hypothetical protein